MNEEEFMVIFCDLDCSFNKVDTLIVMAEDKKQAITKTVEKVLGLNLHSNLDDFENLTYENLIVRLEDIYKFIVIAFLLEHVIANKRYRNT